MPNHLPTYTDQELFSGIRTRDKKVVEYINREYRPLIRLLIYRMGGTPGDGKDIYQDGMITLIRMSEDPAFKLTSSVKTLLYSVCKNLWKYKSRMNQRIVSLNPDQHDGVEEPDFGDMQDMGMYDKLFFGTFNLLPKTCREVLTLHLRNHQNSEIARLLNMSEGYVRKRKSLCIRKMMETIKKSSEYHQLMGTKQTILNTRNSDGR